MPFVIEHSSGVSLYVQLMTQFRAQVESGELIVGTSCRPFASSQPT
jgi:hypothetical protein